jgi:anthranilate synthase/indole-3-glycerol phosphate synthase/phosphoribosylanthranilate isomerase
MQTQIASLRGALEAARMREEKARAEIERYAKESEMMRWEGAAWRRKEAEVRHEFSYFLFPFLLRVE